MSVDVPPVSGSTKPDWFSGWGRRKILGERDRSDTSDRRSPELDVGAETSAQRRDGGELVGRWSPLTFDL